jgi:hypothetical protein
LQALGPQNGMALCPGRQTPREKPRRERILHGRPAFAQIIEFLRRHDAAGDIPQLVRRHVPAGDSGKQLRAFRVEIGEDTANVCLSKFTRTFV